MKLILRAKILVFVIIFIILKLYKARRPGEWWGSKQFNDSVCNINIGWKFCSKFTLCSYLNYKWTNDTEDYIKSLPYNQTSSSSYWLNSLADGILDLSKFDMKAIKLINSENSWSSGNHLWEWIIKSSNNTILHISIHRLKFNYEDIYIEALEKNGISVITSK